MCDNAKRIGVIGEGRAIRKRQQEGSSSSGDEASRTSTSPRYAQSDFGVNICIELFGGNRIHRPIPRHSPCCKKYELLRRDSYDSSPDAGSPESEPGPLDVAAGSSLRVDDISKRKDPMEGVSKRSYGLWSHEAGASRGHPDGEAAISDDFKQFLSKFKDLKVAWEQPEEEKGGTTTPAQTADDFGDSFDSCSVNVKMFFMKYAMTRSDEDKNAQE